MFRTAKNRTAPCENLIANYSIQLALMWLNCILILNRSVQCNGWIRFDLIMSRWYRASSHFTLYTLTMCIYISIIASSFNYLSCVLLQCILQYNVISTDALMRLFCLCSIYTAQVQMYHFGTIHSHNVEFCWFQGEKTVWFCFFSLESFFLTGNGVSKWKMGDFPQKNELAECSIRII